MIPRWACDPVEVAGIRRRASGAGVWPPDPDERYDPKQRSNAEHDAAGHGSGWRLMLAGPHPTDRCGHDDHRDEERHHNSHASNGTHHLYLLRRRAGRAGILAAGGERVNSWIRLEEAETAGQRPATKSNPVRTLYDEPVSDASYTGAADLAEDARQLLVELDRDLPDAGTINTDCRPPLDVFETTASLEILVDIPGVAPDSVRVAVRRSTLLIVGAKLAPRLEAAARFHLAERSYGRFARAVRLTGAFDSGRAKAVASGGQLRVSLPRLEDRRGRILRIPVERE